MDVMISDKNAFVAELLARLRARLSVTHESEKAFALRMGSSEALFKNLAKGSLPAADRLSVLLQEIDETIILGKEPEPKHYAQVASVMVEGTDYASIPLHEAWLSAGPGSENSGANIIDHLAFRRDWLARIGISASQSCLARVMGDSMFPTLSPGDMVLIDTSKTDPQIRSRAPQDKRRPMIWALLDSGEARIKRIERPNTGTILLISDNPDHPPELRTGHQLDQLKVIGKVVWWGHTAST
jgi:phage repressor protein C with HTH and peptisase S24 domain